MPIPKRRSWDAAFPTVVRYCGVVLMIVLVVNAIIGRLEYPALIIAASGMILYKTIHDGGSGRGRSDNGDNEDRWSHLP